MTSGKLTCDGDGIAAADALFGDINESLLGDAAWLEAPAKDDALPAQVLQNCS
jgi:hypothetical protein